MTYLRTFLVSGSRCVFLVCATEERIEMFVQFVAFFLLVWRASAQTVNVTPSSLNGIEGENLSVTCSLEGAPMPVFELRVGGTPLQNTDKSQGGFVTSTGTTFVYGPLSRTEVGLSFVCDSGIGFTASASLDVYCKFIVYFLGRLCFQK